MIKQGGKVFIFILAIAIAGFFCVQNSKAGETILISEVQITGGAGKTSYDFIELYNPNSASFNLKGYRLVKRTKTGAADTNIKSWTADIFIPANGYYLWANSGYIDIAATPSATTTATISDDNGIAIRFGAADAGAIIDSLAWGQSQNVFIEGSVFPANPGANQSLQRKLNSDTDNNSADFIIQEYPNPQNSGLAVAPPAEPPDNPPVVEPGSNETASSTDQNTNTPVLPLSSGTAAGGQKINFGDVAINELVSDPADNEVEWVELYNKADQEIDLTGWWLEDGSKTKTKLEGIIGLSGSNRYKIIEKPAGVLNNNGDLIILSDAGGKIIDQAAYGDWNDGNTTDNAPAAHDPASVARKFDGYNTFNNTNDFAVTIRPTKGASNIIQVEDEASSEAKAKFDFTDQVVISEILPNPTGNDAKLEFIELYNASAREVNLTGWSLSNEDNNKRISFEKIATSAIIKAGEYLALYRTKTKIVLHNDQGQVKLFQPLSDKPLMAVPYKDVKEGWSFNVASTSNNVNTELAWSETPTPGAANIVKAVNRAPTVEFSFPDEARVGQPVAFDSSDTDDPGGDSLKFNWDFGDGFKNNLANPEHTFFKAGIYQVRLTVSEGQETAEKVKNVKVVNRAGVLEGLAETPPLNLPLTKGETSPLYQGEKEKVIINEIFPNPAGADTGKEWAELKNLGANKVNLINWRLENENGQYKFKNDLWLDGKNFYLLTNKDSKLAFKNSNDVISLYNSLDELMDRVEYGQAAQGEAYARGENGKWFWTTKITPAKENIISLANSQGAAIAKTLGTADGALNYIETTLEKTSELEIGSLVKVKGVVAVEPGILAVQIFYIVGPAGASASSTAAFLPAEASSSTIALAKEEEGLGPKAELSAAVISDQPAPAAGAGRQIYNYKKDFPALKAGDYIEVRGELAETQGEFRIKTKDKKDINIIKHGPAPLALALSCDAINEENVGQLIAINGEITDKKAYTAYLDDGNEEVLVYFKKSAGLDTKSLKAGQAVAITGILSKTSTGFRLLPRYQTDIVKIASAAEPKVLGEAIEAQEWTVAERDKKTELFQYLLIIAGGIIIVLLGLFIKAKRKT